MVLPFLTLWLTTRLGFGPAEAGLLAGLYGVGALGGAYGGGWAADRFGARPVMGLSLLGQGLAFIVLPWTPGLGVVGLGAVLLLAGLVGEAFRPATSTGLMLSAPAAKRTKAFALLRLAVNLGMTFGPTVGGLLAARSYNWLFWLDGGTCLVAAGLLMTTSFGRASVASRGPTGDDAGATTFSDSRATDPPPAEGSPWRDRPYLALLGLQVLVALVFFQLLAAFPLTLRSVYGFDEKLIGFTLAINTILVAAFEMVIVQSLEGRRPLLIAAIGALLLGLGFGLTPFGSAPAWLVMTVVIWTAGEILHMPFLATVVAARAGRRMGAYLGGLNLAYSIAFMLAPIVGGWLFEHHGPRSVGVLSMVVGLAAAAGLSALRAAFTERRPMDVLA